MVHYYFLFDPLTSYEYIFQIDLICYVHVCGHCSLSYSITQFIGTKILLGIII